MAKKQMNFQLPSPLFNQMKKYLKSCHNEGIMLKQKDLLTSSIRFFMEQFPLTNEKSKIDIMNALKVYNSK